MSPHLQLANAAEVGISHRTAPITVILADDHSAARRSLRLLLDAEEDVHVIGEADTLTLVHTHVKRHMPHVLVLDLRMPNGSTTQMVRHLRKTAPDTQIVVMTMDDSPAFASHALRAGAIGFVLKERADTELPAAVKAAAAGREYLSPRLAAMLHAMRAATAKDHLSVRETEILRLIALGYTSAEIGRDLNLSRRTVETHRANIFRKLGLHTRAELVAYALRGHLIGS